MSLSSRQTDHGRAWATIGMIWVVIAILAFVSACAASMQYPTRGRFVCVKNPYDARTVIYAEGVFTADQLGRKGDATIYRTIEIARAKPGQSKCMRWPWVSKVGRVVLVSGADTTRGELFNPWDDR